MIIKFKFRKDGVTTYSLLINERDGMRMTPKVVDIMLILIPIPRAI